MMGMLFFCNFVLLLCLLLLVSIFVFDIYDTILQINVHSKADRSQLSLRHVTKETNTSLLKEKIY